MGNALWLPWGEVPEIASKELLEASEKGRVQVVDVRTQMEFKGGHIAGARSIPLLPITTSADRVKQAGVDVARPVVVICLSAHRSKPAQRELARVGFDAKELKGGMNSWRGANLPETRE